MRSVTILGSTGQVGRKAVEVILQHPDVYTVFALVGGRNSALMIEQARLLSPKIVVMYDRESALKVRAGLPLGAVTDVQWGCTAVCAVAAERSVSCVVAAISGIAGLPSVFAALEGGGRVLLANKEALVASGALLWSQVRRTGGAVLPIDSEHNAIFQCLPEALQGQLGTLSLASAGIASIILTASGGPFFGWSKEQLQSVTPELASTHPHWRMGKKLCVDSATLMNKGLEFLEAMQLFNASPSEVECVLHPESMVHGMVRFKDGTLLCALYPPDMHYPIAHALAYPDRLERPALRSPWEAGVSALHFSSLPPESTPALALALAAARAGQPAMTALSAADEVAVDFFLKGQLPFTDIIAVVESVVSRSEGGSFSDLGAVIAHDRWARAEAVAAVQARHQRGRQVWMDRPSEAGA